MRYFQKEGYNVDVTGLGLEQTCGGHITPPYSAPGAVMYHYVRCPDAKPSRELA